MTGTLDHLIAVEASRIAAQLIEAAASPNRSSELCYADGMNEYGRGHYIAASHRFRRCVAHLVGENHPDCVQIATMIREGGEA